MKLFEIEESTNDVKVNAPWIKLIPEFKALFDGRLKSKTPMDRDLIGIKRLTYIYFMLDFTSPIADWEEDKKHTEALTYTGLSNEEVKSDIVQLAMSKYECLQYEMCRPLKTYRAALRGLEAMDTYLETVDFTQTDKQGKLLYTPNQFTTNMSTINKAYDELNKLRKKIEEELSQTTSIRGSATMGDREMKVFGKLDKQPVKTEWEETNPEGEGDVKWAELGDLLTTANGK
jgi:hypothetical protein